jgi:Organic solute transporter Ostalpha
MSCNNSLIHFGDEEVSKETPIFANITFHMLGLWLTATFCILASSVAVVLMLGHAMHYSAPYQQKHIIRILAMIPIYSIISFVSYWRFRDAIYWEVLRDCYEAFAIASFFTLLCHYVEPTLHDQKEYFRRAKVRNWVLPVNWFQKCTGGQTSGLLRKPRSGLTWFNVRASRFLAAEMG